MLKTIVYQSFMILKDKVELRIIQYDKQKVSPKVSPKSEIDYLWLFDF